MRVLITGITGFAGSHLAEYLHGLDGVEVYGTHRWRSRLDNLAELAVAGALNVVEPGASDPKVISQGFRPDKVNLIGGDINDFHSMNTLIAAVQPDRIFHLAAQTIGLWRDAGESMQWRSSPAATTKAERAELLLQLLQELPGGPDVDLAEHVLGHAAVDVEVGVLHEDGDHAVLDGLALARVQSVQIGGRHGSESGLYAVEGTMFRVLFASRRRIGRPGRARAAASPRFSLAETGGSAMSLPWRATSGPAPRLFWRVRIQPDRARAGSE